MAHKNKIRTVLSTHQIKSALGHCERVNKEYMETIPTFSEAIIDYQIVEEKLGDFYVNLGWIQALRFVLGSDTVPISDSPLKYDEYSQTHTAHRDDEKGDEDE
jgi:hypothetical protein